MMRRHALFSWLLLSACSYDFGGSADTANGGSASTLGTGSDAASSAVDAGSTSPATASVTSTSQGLVASASSATSSSTGTILPEVIPSCGGFTDVFDTVPIDMAFWISSNADDVYTDAGELHLDVRNQQDATARLAVAHTPPCAFSFRIEYPGDDDIWLMAYHPTNEFGPIGMHYEADTSDFTVLENWAGQAPVLVEDAEWLAMVVLDDGFRFLARNDDGWHVVGSRSASWTGQAQLAALNRAVDRYVEIDDYGSEVIKAADLGPLQ